MTLQVQLRKAYWSPLLDEQLFDDPIALNLLYIETIADIKSGNLPVVDGSQIAEDLANYRAQKDRKAFLGVASGLKGYGNMVFGYAICSYPQADTKAKVSLGNSNLAITTDAGQEHVFRVQLMRCWRTSSITPSPENKQKYHT